MSAHSSPSSAMKHGYDNLASLIVDSSHCIVSVLQSTLPTTEYNALAAALVDVFDYRGLLMDLFEYLISTEVAATTSAGTLFRNNSLASKSMSCISQYAESREFLNNTLGAVVREISSGSFGSLEIDPAVAPADADVASNLQKLNSLAQRVLDCILASSSTCTPMLCKLCNMLKSYCSQKFPDSSLTSVGGLINLRFFCPAIVTPENYGLVGETPVVEARRTLVLMSKIIQNLSNHVAFREGFMFVLNSFLEKNQASMDSFLDRISSGGGAAAAAPASKPHTTPEKFYDSVHNLGLFIMRVKNLVLLQLPIPDPAKKKEFVERILAVISEIQSAGDPLTNDNEASCKRNETHEKSAKEKAKQAKEEKKRQEKEQKELAKKQKELQKEKGGGHFFEKNMLRVQALLIAGEHMCVAADDGNLAVIEEWVSKDKRNVNAKDPDGQTVLHHACSSGHLNIVRFLLHEKCDCYLADYKNWTALHCAAFEGHLDIVVELCMCRRCDVTATNDDENTPLHYLARIPYVPVMDAILRLFIAGGADVNARNTNNETPLHMAVWKNNVGMVRLLLQNHADPSAKNVKGSTPLDWAKAAQNTELETLFESIVHNSCERPPEKKPSEPALIGAPRLGPPPITPAAARPAPTSPPPGPVQRPTDNSSLSPTQTRSWRAVKPKNVLNKALWDAVRSNSEATVRKLIHEDPSIVDSTYGSNKNTVLHAAVPYGNVAIIKLLLRSVSKIEKNEFGIDPLMSALWQGSEEVVLVFLLSHHKIDMTSRFEDGNTHLHQAALLTGDRIDSIIFALVERGADVNAVNPRQDTPLHLAVRGNNTKAVRSLLDCGAKVNVTNQQHETPLDIAKKNNALAIIPMLEEAHAAEKIAASGVMSIPVRLEHTPPLTAPDVPPQASGPAALPPPQSLPAFVTQKQTISPPSSPVGQQPPGLLPMTYLPLNIGSTSPTMQPQTQPQPARTAGSPLANNLISSPIVNGAMPGSPTNLSPTAVPAIPPSTLPPSALPPSASSVVHPHPQIQLQQQQAQQQPAADGGLDDYGPSQFTVYN